MVLQVKRDTDGLWYWRILLDKQRGVISNNKGYFSREAAEKAGRARKERIVESTDWEDVT